MVKFKTVLIGIFSIIPFLASAASITANFKNVSGAAVAMQCGINNQQLTCNSKALGKVIFVINEHLENTFFVADTITSNGYACQFNARYVFSKGNQRYGELCNIDSNNKKCTLMVLAICHKKREAPIEFIMSGIIRK